MRPGRGLESAAAMLMVGCGFAPESGSYAIDSQSVTEDGCGIYEDEDPPDAPFQVSFDKEAEEVSFGSDFDPCSMPDDTFDCEFFEVVADETSSTITTVASGKGTFGTKSSFDMDFTFESDCDGIACGLASTDFPCTTTIAVSASLAE